MVLVELLNHGHDRFAYEKVIASELWYRWLLLWRLLIRRAWCCGRLDLLDAFVKGVYLLKILLLLLVLLDQLSELLGDLILIRFVSGSYHVGLAIFLGTRIAGPHWIS